MVNTMLTTSRTPLLSLRLARPSDWQSPVRAKAVRGVQIVSAHHHGLKQRRRLRVLLVPPVFVERKGSLEQEG